MTYDYSKGSSLGPNAPLSWVADILGGLTSLRQEYKQKILMGLPMYGWRGGTEAMIGVIKSPSACFASESTYSCSGYDGGVDA